MFSSIPPLLKRLVLCMLTAAGAGLGIPMDALSQTSAAAPVQIDSFSHWRVYELGSGADKVCYILSEPLEKLPKNVRRGKIYFSVMHWPANGIRNEASVSVGYPFSTKSNPYARIGSDDFDFDSGVQMGGDKSWAWMRNPVHHDRLIDMMRRGNQLVFKGTSARGTLTTDTYSLIGFSKALDRINQACPA